jgi:hypothetical protein
MASAAKQSPDVRRRRGRTLAWVRNIGIAACALALLGCTPRDEPLMRSATAGEPRMVRPAPSIPPSVRALLEPLPAPTCALPANETNVDERQKLDYERQCFRQAEIIVRDKLSRLQSAVAKFDRAN